MDTPAPAPPHSLHSSKPVTSVLASVIGLGLQTQLELMRTHACSHAPPALREAGVRSGVRAIKFGSRRREEGVVGLEGQLML